tara:strand:+ start:42 stop:410 length:369 start_codon:yes stop_codon:yes gene_type:complete
MNAPNSTSPGSVAERLQEVRISHEFTVAELARRSGVSECTIRDLEAARRDTRCQTMVALCQALGVSMDWMMGLERRSEQGDRLAELVEQMDRAEAHQRQANSLWGAVRGLATQEALSRALGG